MKIHNLTVYKLYLVAVLVLASCRPSPPPIPETETLARQGIAASANVPECGNGKQWRMSWSWIVPDTIPSCYEHVPMLYSPSVNTDRAVQTAEKMEQKGLEYLTVHNECSDIAQCNVALDAQVSHLIAVIDAYAVRGLSPKIIIGGENSLCFGRTEAIRNRLINYYGSIPLVVAGWHVHLYPDVAPISQDCVNSSVQWIASQYSAEMLLERFRAEADRIVMIVSQWAIEDGRDYELLVTEYGCLACPFNNDYLDEYLVGTLEYFNCESCLGRSYGKYAIYTDKTTGFEHMWLSDGANWNQRGLVFNSWTVLPAIPLPDNLLRFPSIKHPEPIGYPAPSE